MRWSALLYGGLGAAALTGGLVVPWLVHSSGSAGLPGWRGLVNPGELSQAHAFLAGECEACHMPHMGVEAKACLTCHAANSFTAKPSTRFHAQAQRCGSCHFEHQGRRSPTAMDHAVLLRPSAWRPGAAPPVTAHPGSLDCASCHGVSDPHQGLMGQACNSCHGVKTWKIESFRHPATTSAECAECHRPPPSHSMMHFSMVSQRVAGRRARVEQCFACHTTDDWNNIQRAGRFAHH